MLFNSYEFIFVFLPLTLLVFHLIGKQGHYRVAIAWLVGASLFFYSWWNPAYLGLMLFSIIFNYSVGVLLNSSPNILSKKPILAFGIILNLGVLGYYKYANFFVDNINYLSGSNIIFNEVILPLAISFFTFQQIAYLVDAYRGEAREYNFLHYCLFVTFFPQLIAGPIVHHKEMLPQFARDITYRIRSEHLAVGLTIFAVGLFKKVVLADGVSAYASPVFDAAEAGIVLSFFEAWGGALAYSLQLYFDFSGYSDMAIGLARMFGIQLPLNFDSPYKATSIIDFWKRWHITLSRFLRDYLYIPLGGSRKGEVRRFMNLMITMLLGGLWHGAGWTFVLWRGLHGIYLVINHGWIRIYKITNMRLRIASSFSWGITILAVVFSWVPFRATSIDGATSMLTSMLGGYGLSLSPLLKGKIGWLSEYGITFEGMFYNGIVVSGDMVIWVLLLFMFAVFFPNTQQIMGKNYFFYKGNGENIPRIQYQWMEWKPSMLWVVIISGILTVSVVSLSKESEFLYFQF
jgi:alginate O-acetyltransferase complex protein AlgI